MSKVAAVASSSDFLLRSGSLGRRLPRASTSQLRRVVAICLLFLVATHLYWPIFGNQRPPSVPERARRILHTTPLIDGHNDFPALIRELFRNRISQANFTEPFLNGTLPYHVDLKRLREGKNGGAFWSAFVPCPANDSDFSDANYASAVQSTLDQIEVVDRLREAFPRDFSPHVDAHSAMYHWMRGQLISPIGVEGLHQIGNKASNLRLYHRLGVRYVTLTHNCHNRYADAAVLDHPTRAAEPLWGGLSAEGQLMVREMNRIGMLVDISHVSEDTMRDVLGGTPGVEGSRAPVIFSHSSAYSICPHPRNVKDEILSLVKATDSVVMVNFYPAFTSCKSSNDSSGIPSLVPETATLAHIVRHIVHIGDSIGFRHVGLGSDFDGIPSVPRGLEDVSSFPALVEALLDAGVQDQDVRGIIGLNVLRVWRAAEQVSHKMQLEGVPVLEDEIHGHW